MQLVAIKTYTAMSPFRVSKLFPNVIREQGIKVCQILMGSGVPANVFVLENGGLTVGPFKYNVHSLEGKRLRIIEHRKTIQGLHGSGSVVIECFPLGRR